MFVISAIVIGKLSANPLAETLAGPGALFDVKDLMIFPTSFSVTDTCHHANSRS